jgi:hypothetical protein
MQYMMRTTGSKNPANTIWDWSAKGRAITRTPGFLNQSNSRYWATVGGYLSSAFRSTSFMDFDTLLVVDLHLLIYNKNANDNPPCIPKSAFWLRKLPAASRSCARALWTAGAAQHPLSSSTRVRRLRHQDPVWGHARHPICGLQGLSPLRLLLPPPPHLLHHRAHVWEVHAERRCVLGLARNLLPVTLCFPEARNDTIGILKVHLAFPNLALPQSASTVKALSRGTSPTGPTQPTLRSVAAWSTTQCSPCGTGARCAAHVRLIANNKNLDNTYVRPARWRERQSNLYGSSLRVVVTPLTLADPGDDRVDGGPLRQGLHGAGA